MEQKEEKQQEKEEPVEMPEGYDSLSIGGIILTSRYFLITDPIKIFAEMAKTPELKDYLENINEKRKLKDMSYLG